jgi:DNA-binding NtrC family response regulator
MKFFEFLRKPVERSLKIYAVDDEEYYLNLVKVNLSKLGYKDVKIFTNGEDLLLEIINEKPDCVILDYLISENMNGDDILKQIKRKYKDIEVIILSGQEDVKVATDIVKMGASDYVIKNKMTFFNIGTTLSRIKDVVNSVELGKWKTRRIKSLYVLLILITWIVLGVSLYIRLKNGFNF